MSEIQNPSMRPGKPAMLDIATVKPASEKPSDAAFSTVLKEQIDVTVSAEGGKPLPEGGQLRLKSRQLLGGTRIKVSGEEPSAKGLEEFARSQGIDPQALGLLKELEDSSEPMSASVAEKQSASQDGSAEVIKGVGVKGLDIDRAMTRVANRIEGASSLVTAALEAHALLDSSRSVGPQLQIQSAALYDDVDDQATMAVDPTTGEKVRASAKLVFSPDKLEGLGGFNGVAPTEMTRTADSPKELVDNVASRTINHTAVKEAVLPFNRFPGVDTILSPEMRSTGEVMGLDKTFESAFLKAQLAAGIILPENGKVFISIKDNDKSNLIIEAGKILSKLGFKIISTKGTSIFLGKNNIATTNVNKVFEGRPNIADLLKDGKINLVFNTTEGSQSIEDSKEIRSISLRSNIPYFTTAAGCNAAARAIDVKNSKKAKVYKIQDLTK